MRLNKYFTRKEFECKCGCGMDTVDAELLEVLTDLREHYGQPVYIISGNRCETYNKKIGGARKSQHLHSKAADIFVKDVLPTAVYEYLNRKYPDTYGLGMSTKFTHVDVRSPKARWHY
jgi:uncharacterized protein YcbK (DUF882 family)